MAKLYVMENIVLQILEEYPETRKDDYILYLYVCMRTSKKTAAERGDFLTFPFFDVMISHKLYNMPSWETVSRCRRRLQAEYPHLKDPEMAEIRAREEEEYREYAKS